MNSFRALQAALAYEVRRQAEVLRGGGTLVQETRGWDEACGETLPQRSKEFAHDYRYFPEPDLPPLEFSPAYVEEVRASLPELADARRARLVAQYGLREADAATITASKALADFYEAAVAATPDGAARPVANYLRSDVGGLLNAAGIEIDESKLTPQTLAAVVRLLRDGTLSSKTARAVLEETFTTGKDPAAIVKEKGLTRIADPAQLEPIVRTVVASSSKTVADYKAGKTVALEALLGKVMGQTRGRADPDVARELLQKALAE
jgi:aspartyl-tRNA(Asn)/glutamyl-tRNA(Gln) amidotransferase subunit B